jgi:hypothetical protein
VKRTDILEWLINLVKRLAANAPPAEVDSHAVDNERLLNDYGIRLIESDPKGNSRPLTPAERHVLRTTMALLGPAWYGAFRDSPINFWIDRNPGGGHYGNGWLRVGDFGGDLSALYRILLHEGTHASNEYRGWMYEHDWCTRPGLDWVRKGDDYTHPRQQGRPLQPGAWETLPVDSRDVSTAPGEDLAEMVRYYVHSVKNERPYLWPLDQRQPALYLWATSPTRHVFVRDVFLKLSPGHALYRRLSPEQEARAAKNLGRSEP